MPTVNYEELATALDLVSSVPPMGGSAYVSLDTGKVYWTFDFGDAIEQELPPDLETSDRYLEIPHKNNLDLGRDLAMRFVEQHLPEHYERVYGFFQRRGAYARFKDLLEREDALGRWHSFQDAAVEEALREWCAENGLAVVRT